MHVTADDLSRKRTKHSANAKSRSTFKYGISSYNTRDRPMRHATAEEPRAVVNREVVGFEVMI
jgi:hypothetical protein